jgi:hypothetical protein
MSTFEMADSAGGSGITSVRTGYSWSQGSFGDLLIFEYAYINGSSQDYDNVYVGLYMDFDLTSLQGSGHAMDDRVGHDEELNLAYMYDDVLSPNHIGVMGLSKEGREFGFHYWNWNYDPDTDHVFYERLSDVTVEGDLPDSAHDYRIFVNTGPFALAQGETLRVTYGVAAGVDLPSLLSTADGMRSLFESFGAEEARTGMGRELLSVRLYPNPTQDLVHASLSLSAESDVALEVFDAGGRSMLEVGPFRESEILLDFRHLSPGVYFVELRAADLRTTRRILRVR